jgi:hypothetical protein
MIRAPIGGPGRGDWRLPVKQIDANPEFVERCMLLWDEGLDTKEIADIVFQWEHVVERCIRLGRERRKAER